MLLLNTYICMGNSCCTNGTLRIILYSASYTIIQMRFRMDTMSVQTIQCDQSTSTILYNLPLSNKKLNCIANPSLRVDTTQGISTRMKGTLDACCKHVLYVMWGSPLFLACNLFCVTCFQCRTHCKASGHSVYKENSHSIHSYHFVEAHYMCAHTMSVVVSLRKAWISLHWLLS